MKKPVVFFGAMLFALSFLCLPVRAQSALDPLPKTRIQNVCADDDKSTNCQWHQPLAIQGLIKDSLGLPLDRVNVLLRSSDGIIISTTKSEPNGQFTFKPSALGTYAVIAEKNEFESAVVIVTVIENSPTVTELTLAPQKALEVALSATRIAPPRNALSPTSSNSQYSFRQDDIQAQAKGDNATMNDLLLHAPGVIEDNFGQIHIRGDHGNIQYRINGIVLPDGVSGFGSALDIRFASRINLLTGALPAQYGYHTAGVVEIETKSNYDNGGRVGISTGSHGEIKPTLEKSGRIGALNYYLNASWLQNNIGLDNPTASANALHDRTNQSRGFAFLSMHPSTDSQLSLIMGGYDGRYQIPNQSNLTPDPQSLGYTTSNGNSSFNGVLNENQREVSQYSLLALKGNLSPISDYQVSVFQRYSSLIFTPDWQADPLYIGSASKIFKSHTTRGLQADINYLWGEDHSLKSGIFFSNESIISQSSSSVFPVNTAGQVTGSLFTILDSNPKSGNRQTGLYIQDEWKAHPRWVINYGLRLDILNAYVKDTQISPRLGAIYHWDSKTHIHASYARYFTPPPTELVSSKTLGLFSGTSMATPINKNDSVLAEKDNYYEIGITHQPSSAMSLGLNGYYKDAKNLLDEGQFGPAPIMTPFNYQQGRIFGLEGSLNYKKGDVDHYLNISRSSCLGRNIISSQANSGFQTTELSFIQNHWVHCDHDQKYAASAGSSYRWHNTRYSADALFGSGLRKTDTNGTPNGDTLGRYLRFNVSAVRRIKNDYLENMEVRFSIINLFDRVYELRDGTGIGVGPPAFILRRSLYAGISKSF